MHAPTDQEIEQAEARVTQSRRDFHSSRARVRPAFRATLAKPATLLAVAIAAGAAGYFMFRRPQVKLPDNWLSRWPALSERWADMRSKLPGGGAFARDECGHRRCSIDFGDGHRHGIGDALRDAAPARDRLQGHRTGSAQGHCPLRIVVFSGPRGGQPALTPLALHCGIESAAFRRGHGGYHSGLVFPQHDFEEQRAWPPGTASRISTRT